MTGTVNTSALIDPESMPPKLNRIQIDWTTDASGNASGDFRANGTIIGMKVLPGAGGSQPTDNFKLSLTDRFGFDVLRKSGDNDSQSYSFRNITANANNWNEGLNQPVGEKLTLNISDAGNAKSGSVALYLR